MLEILLALALIGLLSATMIGYSSRIMNAKVPTASDVFWQATMAARKQAVLTEKDVRITFDQKAKAFVLDNGAPFKTLTIPGAPDDLQVDFVSTQPGASTMLLAGTVVSTQKMPFVTFFSDGTCVPFAVQFVYKNGVQLKNIDPWTCAEVLKPLDSNGVPIPALAR